jgi:16S rRNA (cytosine1402-N4)-methyltransferase
MPERAAGPQPTFAKPAKAVKAGEAELARNPRARSATLRAAIRTSAPAHQSLRSARS